MRAGFTEFTYAFALMEELANRPGRKPRTLPIIPSLQAEGRVGGGYDLKLNDYGRGGPVFIQFKVSDYMKRRNAMGWSCFDEPFYRFKIWSRMRSNQHQPLLDLEKKHHGRVWYVAPAFHQEQDLSDYYATRSIRSNSIWVRPSAIGSFADTADHYISHIYGGPAFRFSEPERIEEGYYFDDEAALSLNNTEESLSTSLEQCVQDVLTILDGAQTKWEPSGLVTDRNIGIEFVGDLVTPRQLIARLPVAAQVEFLARHYFGCATVLVAEEINSKGR